MNKPTPSGPSDEPGRTKITGRISVHSAPSPTSLDHGITILGEAAGISQSGSSPKPPAGSVTRHRSHPALHHSPSPDVSRQQSRSSSYTGGRMLEATVGRTGSSQLETPSTDDPKANRLLRIFRRVRHVLWRYAQFVGPGFIISVAYIDPGNYATDVSAGATYRYKLLFVVLLSNLFAIFLQSLCIKLGSVTGMNLAEMIKAHCPRWLNIVLYLFAECAIIATDIAEVIGTAIALNLLLHIPLVAGCAISIVDVLVILFFYRPDGKSMRALRTFEVFVMLLVLGVVVCFCIQLSEIKDTPVGDVFRGFLPSATIVQGQALYQSCGILGATVMPHSLYLGSGIIQARLWDYDHANGKIDDPALTRTMTIDSVDEDDAAPRPSTNAPPPRYRPSLAAIKSCTSYAIAELSISLFTFALFVNSAILIVAGASLSNISSAANANLFGIHSLLSSTLNPAAGTIFALALLLSGTSAGIVCTIAGQMVSEGQLSLTVKPWVRRLMTRSISITPSIIIAGAVGKEGLSTALEASQVVLSVILPFVSAPLIYFTCRERFMKVEVGQGGGGGDEGEGGNGGEDGVEMRGRQGRGDGQNGGADGGVVYMRNHWVTTVLVVLVWLVIVVMNVALLVLLGLGVT